MIVARLSATFPRDDRAPRFYADKMAGSDPSCQPLLAANTAFRDL